MLHVDAAELYDLSEAGRILRADPVRIRRWARVGQAPLVTHPQPGLPRAWVEAETGRSGSDAEALLRYWCERLAPPSQAARRASRDASRLGGRELLTAEETARHLHADPRRLQRLQGEGALPGLTVDGVLRYDAALVEHLAAGDAAAAEPRRGELAELARYEYVTDLDAGATPPPTQAPAAPREAVAAAPRAWHLPDDLKDLEGLPEGEPPADTPQEAETAEPPADGSRLIRTEGFETVDED